jgi:hypothetical protein
VRKLPYDVQRDMTFYQVIVGFRNAVELMLIIRGRPLDPDQMWWGFGRDEPPPRRRGSDRDDDGLAGSRVPKRPYGGSGAATVELAPPFDGDLAEPAQVELRP